VAAAVEDSAVPASAVPASVVPASVVVVATAVSAMSQVVPMAPMSMPMVMGRRPLVNEIAGPGSAGSVSVAKCH
jgi:hypothetical protein